MTETLYLFTSATCPKCPEAKNFCKINFPDCKIIEVGNLESLVLAEKYSIRSVPTIIVTNETKWKSLTLTELKDAKKNNQTTFIEY